MSETKMTITSHRTIDCSDGAVDTIKTKRKIGIRLEYRLSEFNLPIKF